MGLMLILYALFKSVFYKDIFFLFEFSCTNILTSHFLKYMIGIFKLFIIPLAF
jgi:hypothetical protein